MCRCRSSGARTRTTAPRTNQQTARHGTLFAFGRVGLRSRKPKARKPTPHLRRAYPRLRPRTRPWRAEHITRTPFDEINGNIQGFARGRAIAVNPVAGLPHKTPNMVLLFNTLGSKHITFVANNNYTSIIFTQANIYVNLGS